MHAYQPPCQETGWRITHVTDTPGSERKVFTMWDDAVMVTRAPSPARRDSLVTALFGPPSGAGRE